MNGPETHEWRLEQLEQRMDTVEKRIQQALYLLIANLAGVVTVLGKMLLFH